MVTRVDALIKTGNAAGAGTNAVIYLGLGGREFRLDTVDNDLQAGSTNTFILGSGSNVQNASKNDPSALTVGDVSRYPIYIRLERSGQNQDDWQLDDVTVTVNPGPTQQQFNRFVGAPTIWLGDICGKILYIHPGA